MYAVDSTVFKKKKNYIYYNNTFLQSDQVVEWVTGTNIVVSEIELETFKATKSLEEETFKLIRTLEKVKTDAVEDTDLSKNTQKRVSESEKPSATIIDILDESVQKSDQIKLKEVSKPNSLAVESESRHVIQQANPEQKTVATINAATSTTKLLARQQSISAESNVVEAENGALVLKNGILNSLSETQRVTINELQHLVDKLNADCADQRRIIALHQRTLRVRCDVLDSFTSLRSMNPKCCVADLFADTTTQFQIAARSEEMSNLFSTLSEKHRCVLSQRKTIEMLQETNQVHINRINQLERDVANLQINMKNYPDASIEYRKTRLAIMGQ